MSDHVVQPETRREMIDGRIMEALPALPPHADSHLRLSYVLCASVAPGYVAAVDMLTRTSERWNFAADASIRKEGTDPETGTRYLEELAFEIKHTQSWRDLTARARQLADRGVRRVFAIEVKGRGRTVLAGPVHEWSADRKRWVKLAPDQRIEDPSLRCPIKVRALLDAAESDDAVAQALIAMRNPVIEERDARIREQGREEGKREGQEEGRAEALRTGITDLCEVLGIELTAERRARLGRMRVPELETLREHMKTRRCWHEA